MDIGGGMKKEYIISVIAAGMSGATAMANHYGFDRVGKGSTPNKYKPHQGKQECDRRLRKYSAAWHSGK